MDVVGCRIVLAAFDGLAYLLVTRIGMVYARVWYDNQTTWSVLTWERPSAPSHASWSWYHSDDLSARRSAACRIGRKWSSRHVFLKRVLVNFGLPMRQLSQTSHT